MGTSFAINQTRFVFAKVMKGVSADDAADFLDELRKNAPVRIWSAETSDHEAFTHPKGRPWDYRSACRTRPCDFLAEFRGLHVSAFSIRPLMRIRRPFR